MKRKSQKKFIFKLLIIDIKNEKNKKYIDNKNVHKQIKSSFIKFMGII